MSEQLKWYNTSGTKTGVEYCWDYADKLNGIPVIRLVKFDTGKHAMYIMSKGTSFPKWGSVEIPEAVDRTKLEEMKAYALTIWRMS